MKKNFILFLLFIFLIFSCQKQEKCNTMPGDRPWYTFYISFMDTLGNDFLLNNNFKAGELQYEAYMYPDSMIVLPFSEIKDTLIHNRYIFRIKANFNEGLLRIGQKVVDTVRVVGMRDNFCKENKDYYFYDSFFNDTISGFIYLRSLYYNDYLLSPPQFKEEKVWNVHRVVIQEDY